jgi:asparagine synthase (glutamine-hydrolysing)
MCGIFGVIDLIQPVDIKTDVFKDALMKMIHRGPDNQSVLRVNEHCLLGHVRLSIIDLEAHSNQPFVDPNQRYHLVYNGEIFNYVELREELKVLGCTFRTDSDTEVLLQAYIVWGEACVERFNGMWAFVIYDAEKNTIFCSRDRYGIKPLYYSKIGAKYIISSEIKPILALFPELREVNCEVIAQYIQFSVNAQLTESWFKNIKRIDSATNLTITKTKIEFNRYYEYPSVIPDEKSENAIEDYQNLFYTAVNLRLRSDVSLGLTLSGGLDSSSILAAASQEIGNLKAYSIGKSGFEYDESKIAEKLSQQFGVDFKRIEYDDSNYVNDLSKSIYFMESGSVSMAIPQYYQLIKELSKDTTVVLEGQGADELLAGYFAAVIPYYLFENFFRGNFRSVKNELKLLLGNSGIISTIKILCPLIPGYYWLTRELRKFGISKPKDNLVVKKFRSFGPTNVNSDRSLNSQLLFQHQTLLKEYLHYGDSISMSCSVESRLPFMDFKLVDMVFSLSSDFKIKDGHSKWIHRKIFDGKIDDSVNWNKSKLGFATPISKVWDAKTSEGLNIIKSLCQENRGIINERVLNKMLSSQDSINCHEDLLYRLLSVELWFRLFIDGNEIDGLKV